mmetsp:Transcript_35601/g.49668  ORF Transcript_35601/g.49668 Transcript_35601/m.49668 type:complete len:303 (+) Transcript_35601:393-1301(+)
MPPEVDRGPCDCKSSLRHPRQRRRERDFRPILDLCLRRHTDVAGGDAALFRLRRRPRELLQDPQGAGSHERGNARAPPQGVCAGDGNQRHEEPRATWESTDRGLRGSAELQCHKRCLPITPCCAGRRSESAASHGAAHEGCCIAMCMLLGSLLPLSAKANSPAGIGAAGSFARNARSDEVTKRRREGARGRLLGSAGAGLHGPKRRAAVDGNGPVSVGGHPRTRCAGGAEGRVGCSPAPCRPRFQAQSVSDAAGAAFHREATSNDLTLLHSGVNAVSAAYPCCGPMRSMHPDISEDNVNNHI